MEKTEIPVDNIVIIDDADLGNGINRFDFEDTVIMTEASWLKIADEIDFSEELGFDSELFKERSLAAAVVTRNVGTCFIRVTSAMQDRFTVTVDFSQYDAYGVATSDEPPTLIFVPVDKTVIKTDFIYDGFVKYVEENETSPFEAVELGVSAEFAETVGNTVIDSLEEYREMADKTHNLHGYEYSAGFFEKNSVAVAVIEKERSVC